MGRKSLATERRAEILAAFEHCIVSDGLDVSLERVAAVAGVQRSIIRHYLGNREQVLDELITRITREYLGQIRDALAETSIDTAPGRLLDMLFERAPENASWDKIIVDVLVSAKERYPRARQQLNDMFRAIVDLLAGELGRRYPLAPRERQRSVAYALFCLAMTNDDMLWLGFDPSYTASVRDSAALLLASLGAEQ